MKRVSQNQYVYIMAVLGNVRFEEFTTFCVNTYMVILIIGFEITRDKKRYVPCVWLDNTCADMHHTIEFFFRTTTFVNF